MPAAVLTCQFVKPPAPEILKPSELWLVDELFIFFIDKADNTVTLTYCHDIVSKLNKKVVMSLT